MPFGSFLGSIFHFHRILSSFIVHVSGQTRSYTISAKICGFSNNNSLFVLNFNLVHCKIRTFFLKIYNFFFFDLIFFFRKFLYYSIENILYYSIENIHIKFKKEMTKFADFVCNLLVVFFSSDNPL